MLAKPGIVCYNSFCCTARSTDGKLAQLGEHPLDVWKVVGSSPILSRKASPKGGAFLYSCAKIEQAGFSRLLDFS